jgi:hypothetical protein
MAIGTNEPIMELVNMELLIFKWHQVNIKILSVFYNGGENMNQCFLFIDFLAYQTLSIVRSQIEFFL